MLFKDISIIDEDFRAADHMYVRTEGAFITYVGKDEPALTEGEEIYSGKDRVLLPGFYNTHCHVPMTMLRGYGEGLGLSRWLNERIFPFEAKLSAEDVYWSTKLGALELIASGTASVSDMYFFIEDIAAALDECGLKANICHGISSPDPHVRLEDMKGYKDTMSLDRSIRQGAFGGIPGSREGSRIRADMCMHAEYTSTEALARQIAECAVSEDMSIHVHVSETRSEHEECMLRHGGLSPVRFLEECGFFRSRVQAAHCVWLDDEDMEIMRTAGAYAIHNPSSNLKLGSGIMPLKKFLDCGLMTGLGTDGASSNNNLNMLEEIHMAAMLARGISLDANAVSPGEMLRTASRNGALCQGRTDCGLIKEGSRADLIVISLDAPHMQPVSDISANIVFSAQSSDIVLNMTDGRVIYKNGEYTYIDRERVIYETKRHFENILKKL